MILIQGIPVVAARLAAEEKAKDWLTETRRRASEAIIQAKPAPIVTRCAKAA